MTWQETVYSLIGLFIGVVLHEYMHARVADWRGDRTARNAGRLTLNPIPSIDPFGTVLLPLAMVVLSRVTGGSFPPFGYAKPVPVNPFFLRRRRDMILVALAGPLTNFTLALGVALIGRLVHVAGVQTTTLLSSGGIGVSELFQLFYWVAVINVWLGIFNLMPIPPLDGSHILEYYLPASAQEAYERIAPFGMVIVLAFFYIAGGPLFRALDPLFKLVGRIMGIPLA